MSSPEGEDEDVKMRATINLFSSMTAVSQSQSTCPIHEDCDGSCTGHQITFEPIICALEGENVYRAVREAQPRLLGPNVICHDTEWLANLSLDEFECTHIDSSSAMIRLLRIKPARFRKDVIECEIFDACLDKQPTFAALSYHWGPPCFDHQIICNGKVVSITASLDSALKRHRQDTNREKHDVLWVDALCINQRDKIELSEQLQLMRRIYGQAAVVQIDLGDIDNMWYPSYDLLTKLCLIHEIEEKKEPQQQQRTPKQIRQAYGLPEPDHVAWKIYRHLFTSPWFLRTWVVQEITLASHATVRCGVFGFKSESLWQSMDMTKRLDVALSAPKSSQGVLNMYKLDTISRIYKDGDAYIFRRRGLLPGAGPLLNVMILTRDFLVSDLQDRIFAVLALADDQELNGGSRPFRADYTLSIEKLYHRFAVHLCDTYYTVPMLSLAGLHRRALDPESIPTWVPDWSAQSREAASAHMAMFRPRPYAATAGSAPYKILGVPARDRDPDILISRATASTPQPT